MTIYSSKHETIVLLEKPFASGGEGSIYKVESAPSNLQNVCVKIYHPHVVNKQREDRIKYMVANPPSQIRGEGFMLGWPVDYVTDADGKFLGFIMPLGFSDSKELVNLTATTLSKKLGQEWQERYVRSLGKKALISRLKLICNIAIPVHTLHSTGKYVLKDFKPQNVLATADGRITICDMDSIQIAEGGKLLFSGTAATPDYIPPEFYSKGIGKKATDVIGPSWDTFSMGVVFYQLLFGIHPYVVTPKEDQADGSNSISHNISSGLFPFGVNGDMVKVRPTLHDKFMILPQELQDLFIRTFADNGDERPRVEEWGRYIHGLVIENDIKDVDEDVVDDDKKEDGDVEKQKKENDTTNGCLKWIVLALIAMAVIGVICFLLVRKDAVPASAPVETEEMNNFYSDSEEVTPDIEEFKTERLTKEYGSTDDTPYCYFVVDYPIEGKKELVDAIRKWINRVWPNMVGGDQYSLSLEDGDKMMEYYLYEAVNVPHNCEEVYITKEYEGVNFVSYQYSGFVFETDGMAHPTGGDGGASFSKTDGEIIDWGMFLDNSDMQYIIKAGLKKYFGNDRFHDQHIPLPASDPILLEDGVKFVYGTYEIEGSCYADGAPSFVIDYYAMEYVMTSPLHKLLEGDVFVEEAK